MWKLGESCMNLNMGHCVLARVLTSCGQLRLDPCTGMSKHWHGAATLGHLPDAQALVCVGHSRQTREQ